jgi:hypothetical protein
MRHHPILAMTRQSAIDLTRTGPRSGDDRFRARRQALDDPLRPLELARRERRLPQGPAVIRARVLPVKSSAFVDARPSTLLCPLTASDQPFVDGSGELLLPASTNEYLRVDLSRLSIVAVCDLN